MGQKIARLCHQFDTQIIIFDSDVDMHAANQQPIHNRAQITRDGVVTFAIGMLLVVPLGKGMGRSRQQRHVIFCRHLGKRAAHMNKLLARFKCAVAHLASGFDLTAHEFAGNLIAKLRLGVLEEFCRRVFGKVAGFAIHEPEFFFYADGKSRFARAGPCQISLS